MNPKINVFTSVMHSPALFLDRDGVINWDYGYVHKKKDFEFIEGIFEVVSLAKNLGYLVVVVTNQSGIGRGLYNERDFHLLMSWMCKRFLDKGGRIDKVYFCPTHPKHAIGQYCRSSYFRKPNPGMLLRAKRELSIDLSNSVMIGDKVSDVIAGRNAGVSTNVLFNNTKQVMSENETTQADLVCHSHRQVLQILTSLSEKKVEM